MAIVETIDESLFISRFEDYKRVKTAEQSGNFTYEGLRHLFNYLDDCYTDDKPLELDVIGLCCDFSEYENLEEYLNNYFSTEEINKKIQDIKDNDESLTEEEIKQKFKEEMEEHINDNTTLIKFSDDLDDGFIIQQY